MISLEYVWSLKQSPLSVHFHLYLQLFSNSRIASAGSDCSQILVYTTNDMLGHTRAHTQETDLLWCITVANILSRSSGTFQETTSQKCHLSLSHTQTHTPLLHLTDMFDHASFHLLHSGKVTLWPSDLTDASWRSRCLLLVISCIFCALQANVVRPNIYIYLPQYESMEKNKTYKIFKN